MNIIGLFFRSEQRTEIIHEWMDMMCNNFLNINYIYSKVAIPSLNSNLTELNC